MGDHAHSGDGHGPNCNHDRNHDHDHGHHHHHGSLADASQATLKRLKVAFVLNLGFAFIELVGGIWANSLAVVSDALHDFGDALALGLALFFEKSSHQTSNQKYTYGYRRLSAVSAVVTGVILLTGSFWILKESYERWSEPQAPQAMAMIGLAILGLSVNGYAAWKFAAGHSLNEKMIRWHLIEDVLGWLVVLIGAIFIEIFQWPQVDTILAVGLSFWVIFNVVKNLRHSLLVFLQAIPEGIDLIEIQKVIRAHPEVSDVHHTHLWTLDGTDHVLTTHVLLTSSTTPAQTEELKKKIKTSLKKFKIVEATIEIEWSAEACMDPHHHG